MPQPSIDFEALALRMRKDLRRIRLLRRTVRCLACISYTFVLAWFGFCLCGLLALGSIGQEVSRYAVAGFVVFCVAHYALLWSFRALDRREERTMRQIVASLFPEASYDPRGKADAKALAASRLFAAPSAAGSSVVAVGYGSLDLPVGDRWMRVADVGVTAAGGKDLGSINFAEVLYRYFVRPIFGARMESTMHDFRGMFGCCPLGHSFRGYVMLLPDRLEDKIGHMAQAVQRLRQRYGAEFVHLEDPEFEGLFVVYASDEVDARMVLTPAMMRRLTALRRTFRRDLMLSFCGDRLYYASATPDGFLRPGRKSLAGGAQLLEQLYREMDFCRTVARELQ